MISFLVDRYHFHYRAAAVVIDDGKVLLKRWDGNMNWVLPGGKVKPGEQAQDTILRVFDEELYELVECGELLCVGENFFEIMGQPHHEIGLYFAVSLPSSSRLTTKNVVHRSWLHGDGPTEFEWFDLSELETTDLRPTTLQSGLAAGQLPPHFVHRDSRSNAV
ncbi:NUDIX hydrolase [Acidovorax sp. 22279]|uniref:NUDIX hydrolase n=1 Tax=Acidovorax sp. 22279 TaxID=3453900 RepID=UPI003F840E53